MDLNKLVHLFYFISISFFNFRNLTTGKMIKITMAADHMIIGHTMTGSHMMIEGQMTDITMMTDPTIIREDRTIEIVTEDRTTGKVQLK